MKNPNGFGSISKLSGNRRRPFMVRVTKGYTDEGKEVRSVLGYYKSRKEALTVLVDYQRNPYDISNKKITFGELCEKWVDLTYTKKGEDCPNSYIAAMKRTAPLNSMSVPEIKKYHLQQVIDECDMGYSTKKNIKTLFNKVFTLGMEYDIITTNYAPLVKLPQKEDSTLHSPFTDAEIKNLWKHTEDEAVQIALVYIYTGFRPTELLKVTLDNVDEHFIKGGMKTAAGKNRLVPIADRIAPIVSKFASNAREQGNAYLLLDRTDNQPIMTYDRLREHYWKKCDMINSHLPHDTRHTCATLMSNADIDIKIQQLILGHSTSNITQRVYTHKTKEQLLEAINRI